MTARTEEQKAMEQMRQGRAVQLLALLSLTLFVLAGCGGGDEKGDNSSQATSRLTVRLTSANQTLSNARRTALPIQAQQEPVNARLRIEISAADLANPIVVNCTLPNPTSNQPCRNIGETDEATLLEVGLQVPRGNDRRIVVTIFDASEAQSLRGEDTVDLTASDVEVTINLSPIFEVSIGSPADPVASGATFTVPVTINTGGTNLVSYLFELTFDPAIVVVIEITGGSAPFDDPVHNPAGFASGTVQFAANNSTFTPASGLLNVANITFEVVAEAAGTSDLILAFPPTPGGTGVLVTDSFAAIEDVTFVSGTVTTP